MQTIFDIIIATGCGWLLALAIALTLGAIQYVYNLLTH